jgi:hypothetical protein
VQARPYGFGCQPLCVLGERLHENLLPSPACLSTCWSDEDKGRSFMWQYLLDEALRVQVLPGLDGYRLGSCPHNVPA